jgi:nicotinate phosphoribosyltransferase
MSENDGDVRDVIGKASEDLAGRPLLMSVMCKGRRFPAGYVDLKSAREYAQRQIVRMPDRVRAIAPALPAYPVEVSRALFLYQKDLEAQLAGA